MKIKVKHEINEQGKKEASIRHEMLPQHILLGQQYPRYPIESLARQLLVSSDSYQLTSGLENMSVRKKKKKKIDEVVR